MSSTSADGEKEGVSAGMVTPWRSPTDSEVVACVSAKLSLTGRAEAAAGRVSALMSEWAVYGGRVETQS